ncbi:glycosyltransferase family 2 protein [Glutamicibacter ardleyensis]|uniref:glycosyltransferase family 2 protein n=1 Tax=Glutamicibacter ardleyensis TaxID=225894 RepID=UPI003FD299DE
MDQFEQKVSVDMRISIVIPVLNDEEYLKILLDHLARQSLPADEIIVVDNGCTDASVTVARSAGATVIVEKIIGIPAAAATGYDNATGDIIVRCDADSRPPADWLEKIDKKFVEDPTTDALTGPGFFYDLPLGTRSIGSVLYAVGYFFLLGSALATVPLWGSNMAFRSTLWNEVRERVSRTGTRIHDDLDLTCAAHQSFVLKFLPTLRMGAAGRVFLRPRGFRDSSRLALNTLARHGGINGIHNRWQSVLGLK